MSKTKTICCSTKIFGISSRALLRIQRTTNTFFSIPVQGGHAGRSRAHVELLLCANPDQRIQRGPRVRVFVCRNPCKTFIFRSESNIKKKHCETDGFSKQASRSDLARSCGFIWGVQCIFNIIDQEGHAGRSRARMSNLSVTRIPFTHYHADDMRARMSEFFQKLCLRSESLGKCNHFPMSFADRVAGGSAGCLHGNWKGATSCSSACIAPRSSHNVDCTASIALRSSRHVDHTT